MRRPYLSGQIGPQGKAGRDVAAVATVAAGGALTEIRALAKQPSLLRERG
jgi:hypothetical protein